MKHRGVEAYMIVETLLSPELLQPAHSDRYAVAKFFPELMGGKYVVVIYEKENDIINVVNVIPRDRKKADKLLKRMRGEDEI
ncbi:MAG: hypothetical protein J7K81_02290 [Methanophagales archaeon]|nr:hypothetical protein [Methanophagales archaeon]